MRSRPSGSNSYKKKNTYTLPDVGQVQLYTLTLFIYAGPPTAVSTKCKIQDDVSISISWKKPASNGAEITWYKVYQRRRNEEEWMEIRNVKNTSSLEFVVKELEKGKEYEFLITAGNKYGESLKKGYCKRVQVPGGR